MREFCSPKDFKIYVCATEDKYNVFTLEELLPHSFGPEFLLWVKLVFNIKELLIVYFIISI